MIIFISAIVIFILCYVLYKWETIKIKVHICSYHKPIVSQYSSFNIRNIVYECNCGKRKIIKVYRTFGEPFPIETTPFITDKELEELRVIQKQ